MVKHGVDVRFVNCNFVFENYMGESIDVYFNYGGTWVAEPYLDYVGGEPGRTLSNGLMIVENDESIRTILNHIHRVSWKTDIIIYASKDENDPVIENSPLPIAVQGTARLGDRFIENVSGQEDEVLPDPVSEPSEIGCVGEEDEVLPDPVIDPSEGGCVREEDEVLGDPVSRTEGVSVGEQDEVVGEAVSGTEGVSVGQHDEVVPDNGSSSSSSSDEEEGADEEDEDSDSDFAEVPTERVNYNESDGSTHFILGMAFADAKEARQAIANYAVAVGRKLKIHPNEPGRVRAKCVTDKGCKFLVFMSKDSDHPGLTLRTLHLEHKCYRTFKNPIVSAKYLANHFRPLICKNPETKVKELRNIVEMQLKVSVSEIMCKRAKRMIKQELEGSFVKEFQYLEAYAAALKRSNPGTAAEIQVCRRSLKAGKRVFKRMFICFDAYKQGWNHGCRPIIGLDGCFLKSNCKGQLLAAIGKDADEQMYPIAWGVIDTENTSNWRWFLQMMTKELQLRDGSSITLISDMQKGLIKAVKEIFPGAEHRWCARHIWANWSKKWGGGHLQKQFWICAWSTYEEEFIDNLKKIGETSKKAAEDLVWYPPHNWSRAFFSNRSKSMMVDNNITECFNSWIKEARYKPIVSMLEDIRIKVMERIASKKSQSSTWFNDWSPASMQKFHDYKDMSLGCKAVWNGDHGFEIGEGDDKHTVFIDKKLCTCRAWSLWITSQGTTIGPNMLGEQHIAAGSSMAADPNVRFSIPNETDIIKDRVSRLKSSSNDSEASRKLVSREVDLMLSIQRISLSSQEGG
ncbi:uncharacterized protein LOC126660546 [Mercurialis annua]|uniref:uncharacterized protein LOC126660546 n=1 Tax=Mercurialis annua TaxID=3986 RepID=UPI00215EF03D|nr:uncharacterized protein LOC126660546 [Mercurialis annua]